MLGDFIAAIFARMRRKDYEKADELLENSYQTLLRTEASFFYIIPVEKLTNTLIEDHHYTNNHLEILSELLFTEAELRFAEEKCTQSLHCFQKAKVLMEFLEQNSGSMSLQRQNNLSLITNRISALTKKKE